jgi:rhamnogalacturonyl hydrolase YesR
MRRSTAILAGLVLVVLAASAPAVAKAGELAGPEPGAVLATAERTARARLAELAAHASGAGEADDPRGWRQAVFWLGMTALADRTGEAWIREAILAHGQAAAWTLGARLYHADDQLIGWVYLWDAAHGAGPEAAAPLRAALDAILAAPPRSPLTFRLEPGKPYGEGDSFRRWSWADALFMAPPTWLELSRRTGDRRYRDYALAEFWAATEVLYDPAEGLYVRDSRFLGQRDAEGRKVFWSRGDGWVFAGLARMIEALPKDDPERDRLVELFRRMAARLVSLQRPDGAWPASLLADSGAAPETSGAALFTYGLAWGVAHGVLERADYEPAARRGWSALEAAVQPDGSLGRVQPPGDRPADAAATHSEAYADGALLLAASAVADALSPRPSSGRR